MSQYRKMSSVGGSSVTEVIIDSIDINMLANKLIGHLVQKNNDKERKFESLDGICVEEGEGTSQDATDGPYEIQRAPDTPAVMSPVGPGQDLVDRPGYSMVGSRKTKVAVVTQAMLQIADELDEKQEIWQLFSTLEITRETAYDTFCDIAMGIFQHGISWGKVVVLFMFAAHCVMKAVLAELPNIFVMIGSFVARFMGEKLKQWIEEHGGWENLTNPDSNPYLKFGGILVAGIVGGIVCKMVWDRLS
ncbi:bcl-2-like protein 1 [Sycon ciliatum]|uniref:bcl-2-like protein 1 n=1 Tax=Sycon ciliatum TaxID=27933 RepID=UPI0020ADB1D8|eukprot:scpid65363/ scgid27242/ Bcl-2-like protein 1; Apoptosis regulator Bcl-X